MAGGIFISYRREDSRHAAGRLHEPLGLAFGRDRVFMDVDAIEPGLDFVEVLNQKLAGCDVLLALIGPGWLDAADAGGQRRLDNPSDFVRLEIEAALRRNIRVIPVLLDDARLPDEESLPAALKPLVRRQAVKIAHERFAADAEGLVRSLATVVAPSPRGRQSAIPPVAGRFAYRLVAWAYALLALPLYVWLNLTEELRIRRIIGRSISEPTVVFLTPLLIAAIGIYLRRARGLACLPSELVLYWIGATLPLAVMAGVATVPIGLERGAVPAVVAVAAAGLVLMVVDLRRHRRARAAANQSR